MYTLEFVHLKSTQYFVIKLNSFLENLNCTVNVPDSYRERAIYGLEMLFLPFRVQLNFEFTDESQGVSLYYGPATPDLPKDTVHLGFVTENATFFEGSTPFPAVERYLKVGEHRVPVLFNGSGDTSFDAVATTFFYLSGWQESKSLKRDEHGRFLFSESIQSRYDLTEQPTIDWYRHVVAELLRKKGLRLERKTWGEKTWAFCPTHDIDYDKKWRPGIIKREVVDRFMLNHERESWAARLARLGGSMKSAIQAEDPFRVAFQRMREEVQAKGGRATYFLKSGGRGLRDVSYSLTDPFVFSQLSALHKGGFEIALHPSYHSFKNPEKFLAEKAALEDVCGFAVTAHRAHYLRFEMPSSAALLDSAGFEIDSTLGFATRGGFRFGTCLPFPLFDHNQNRKLKTWELPLCVMDSALFNRQQLDASQAVDYTNELMNVCRDFGGVFVGLWHNTLWDETDFPGWGAHFLSTLAHSERNKASIDSLKGALNSWK